jgi:hypothetical protein
MTGDGSLSFIEDALLGNLSTFMLAKLKAGR